MAIACGHRETLALNDQAPRSSFCQAPPRELDPGRVYADRPPSSKLGAYGQQYRYQYTPQVSVVWGFGRRGCERFWREDKQ